SGLADVLRGAGLANVPVTPDLARNFGRILRVVVSGVMDVLQARQRIKEEFRIRVTTFKRSDNNPLKFSADVEHALQNLLGAQSSAYLPPVEAFEDAFADIRNHQMAMLAGVRIAFEAMLAQFDPSRLQEEFDRQIKKAGSLRAVPAKMRYWELYRDKVHDMVSDADGSFRSLFGDEFAKAYEEQLDRLKAQSRSGKH
ncbi:MAG: type VI secretion system-associated FHA domain protein TagH, partial [Vicinamibacterales bacterium]